MKKLIPVVLLLLCLASVLGCAAPTCDHYWLTPTGPACSAPWAQICLYCNESRGEPAPHNWGESQDGQPRTCTECGARENSEE